MFQDQIVSFIRTYVPYGVGLLVTWLGIHFSIVLSPQSEALLSALGTFVVGSVYYLVVRALEAKFPKLGVLLGVPAKPHYNTVALSAPNPVVNPSLQRGDRGFAGLLVLLLCVILFLALFGGIIVSRWFFLFLVLAGIIIIYESSHRNRL